MHVFNKFSGFNIDTTAFCLGQYSLHLLLLNSSMTGETPQSYLGHSRAHFLYFRLFYKQLTVNKCSIKIAHDWIWTRALWYRKRPLCQLRHNHCSMISNFLYVFTHLQRSEKWFWESLKIVQIIFYETSESVIHSIKNISKYRIIDNLWFSYFSTRHLWFPSWSAILTLNTDVL